MKVTKYNSRGQMVDIEVDSMGTFSATVDGTTLTAKTLEDLEPKIDRATKQELAKVAIPFVRYVSERYSRGDGKLKHGTITGLHAANNNLLVRFEGEKGSRQEYGSGEYLKLPKEQEEAYLGLIRAAESAEAAREAFENKHRFDGREAVNKALEKAEKATA